MGSAISEDLSNEIDAIHSIFGDGSLAKAPDSNEDVYILSIPCLDVSLRLVFDGSYPEEPPQILGTQSVGESSRKGRGADTLIRARKTLVEVFTPGTVCLFDLLQGLEDSPQETNGDDLPTENGQSPQGEENHNTNQIDMTRDTPHDQNLSFPAPQWVASEAVTIKKSMFIARACPVSSPEEAKAALAHLLENDKHAAKATHNITAYFVRLPPLSNPVHNANEIVYQDYDDDGETAAGRRLLHLMQVMNVCNVLVVVTRWYGGIHLGPDRFRIINQVAREAFVRGGWA